MKELLSKVLNTDIQVVYGIIYADDMIKYDDLSGSKWINVYKLAYKCKSYVVKHSGWTLQSYTNEREAGICRVKVGDGKEINKFIAESEVESIFKATSWVLEELEELKRRLNETTYSRTSTINNKRV